MQNGTLEANTAAHHYHLFPASWSPVQQRRPHRLWGPTHIYFKLPDGQTVHWSSREQRKGRFPRVQTHRTKIPCYRLIGFDVGDVSWWSAFVFTVGSIIWVINGFFAMWPNWLGETANLYAVGYTGFAGGTTFLIGGLFLYWEGLNSKVHAEFGKEFLAAEERFIAKHGTFRRWHLGRHHRPDITEYNQRLLPPPFPGSDTPRAGKDAMPLSMNATVAKDGKFNDTAKMTKGTGEQNGTFAQPQKSDSARRTLELVGHDVNSTVASQQHSTGAPDDSLDVESSGEQVRSFRASRRDDPSVPKWRWVGARWNDMGFVGNFIQCIGAIIFWFGTIGGIPYVLNSESNAVMDVFFWSPQTVGAVFFIISSAILMFETQERWWKIRPFNLGWNVGFWNVIGSIGFELSGFFGYFVPLYSPLNRWGVALSTFWGSWAFLIGSYCQLVEAMNKHPPKNFG